MKTIICYDNARHSLEILKEDLKILLEKKDKIHSKYFSKSGMSQLNKNKTFKDKMTLYVHECTKINPKTGKSLEMEIDEAQSEVNELEEHLKVMTKNLLQMSGIEYEIYSRIVLKKQNISKAIEDTAEVFEKSERQVWDIYNKKIKKFIKLQ